MQQKDKDHDLSWPRKQRAKAAWSGECAILDLVGLLRHRNKHRQVRIQFGPMPLYPTSTGARPNSIIRRRLEVGDGAQEAGKYKGHRQILTFLSDTGPVTPRQRSESGYRRLTKAGPMRQTVQEDSMDKNRRCRRHAEGADQQGADRRNSRGCAWAKLVQKTMRDLWERGARSRDAGKKTTRKHSTRLSAVHAAAADIRKECQ